MVTNSIDQMLIEISPLEAGHGKRLLRVPSVLTSFELGQANGAQTGVEVKVKLGL